MGTLSCLSCPVAIVVEHHGCNAPFFMPLNKGAGPLFVVLFYVAHGKLLPFSCVPSLFSLATNLSRTPRPSLTPAFIFMPNWLSCCSPFHGSGSALWLGSHVKKMKTIPLPFLPCATVPPLTASLTTISFNFRNVPLLHTFRALRFLSLFAEPLASPKDR